MNINNANQLICLHTNDTHIKFCGILENFKAFYVKWSHFSNQFISLWKCNIALQLIFTMLINNHHQTNFTNNHCVYLIYNITLFKISSQNGFSFCNVVWKHSGTPSGHCWSPLNVPTLSNISRVVYSPGLWYRTSAPAAGTVGPWAHSLAQCRLTLPAHPSLCCPILQTEQKHIQWLLHIRVQH